MAAACAGSIVLSVLQNTSTPGNISFGSSRLDLPTGNNPQSVAIGDLDGDGKADLAVTNYGGSSISVMRNVLNLPPSLNTVSNQTTLENTGLSIGFTVFDAESAPGSLVVTGSSSNTALVPNGNLLFGGSGSSRSLLITPAVSQFGTATITLTVSDGSASTSGTFILTVLTPLDSWRTTYFSPAQLQGLTVSGPLADPDGDGMSNLIEYALGKNPMAPDSPGITVGTANGTLTMTYTHLKSATDITITPVWSTDLATWSSSGITQQVGGDDGTIQTISATIPLNMEAKKFMKLQVTLP